MTYSGHKLSVYMPTVHHNLIYSRHPGTKPLLQYNHDADIVRFKGQIIAGWNANENQGENKPGQYNYINISHDFSRWSVPERVFAQSERCQNPVGTDNQWQPSFINYHDQTLFCAWCDYSDRKTYISTSTDGIHWNNREVPTAPPELTGSVVGFPTSHGLLTSKNIMMFPCSHTPIEEKLSAAHSRYAGVLISKDAGETWVWSQSIEAVSWTEIGEDPSVFGGDTIYLWEPVLFEQEDGSIGLLIRNATCLEPPRLSKTHHMLLYAASADDGATWTKARPVEVDTLCSRCYAVTYGPSHDSLLMVHNDNHVRPQERISRDRYFLSLYCAPVCDPDLLLPGPLVQPEGGRAYYPNGYIHDDKLYLAYTYSGSGIGTSLVESLPDFSTPFLLPRGSRPGLKMADGIAHLGQPNCSLGLVLTKELTYQSVLKLSFAANVSYYSGAAFPILTLGGKSRQGTVLRAAYCKENNTDVFAVKSENDDWVTIATFHMNQWYKIFISMTVNEFSISIDDLPAQTFPISLLRKISFGGLYEAPEWPMGVSAASDVQVNLNSIQLA